MDRVSSDVRSKIMASVKPKSGIEIIPHWLEGLYLRKHPKRVFGNPDFGNKTRKIAVFIDGCFWHRCPAHYREPQSNRDYWLPKVAKNVVRDSQVNLELEGKGWSVHRIWECQISIKELALATIHIKPKC